MTNSFREKLGQRLESLVERFPTKKDAAKAAGVTLEQFNKWLQGGTKVPAEALYNFARVADADLTWLITGKGSPEGQEFASLIEVPVLNVRASAGHGAWNEDEEVIGKVPLTRLFLHSIGASPEHTRIIWANGSSMEPTIAHQDMLLVDTQQTDPRVGGIFVFREREWLHVKRVKVSTLDGSVMFGSDNPEYGPFTPEALDSLDILGRVVWIGRRPR